MSCAVCGAGLGFQEEEGSLYGSPIRICPSCGTLFLDRAYREIAVDGFREADRETGSRMSWFGRIVIALAVMGAMFIALVFTRNPISAVVVGALIWGVLAALEKLQLSIRSARKRRKLEAYRMESEVRLDDRTYAHTLRELGYSVPERYL